MSWTYNEGCGNVGSSTLVKRLKAGENVDTVCSEELPKWTYSNGKQLPGLVKRRAAEVKLCKTASSVAALPAKKCF